MLLPEILLLTIVFESYCPAISTIPVKKMKSKEVSEASWSIKKGHNFLASCTIYNTIRDVIKNYNLYEVRKTKQKWQGCG